MNLATWVESCRAQGIEDADIGMQLLNHGYTPGQVAEALKPAFAARDDPKVSQKIQLLAFIPVFAVIGLLLLYTELVVASIWGIILIGVAGHTVFSSDEYWPRPRVIMVGLLSVMITGMLALGHVRVAHIWSYLLLLCAPITGYLGWRLLKLSRSPTEEIVMKGQRPVIDLAVMFLMLYLMSIVVAKATELMNPDFFSFLGEFSGVIEKIFVGSYINAHVGFAVSVILFLCGLLIPEFRRHGLGKKELRRDIVPYVYAILGYVVVAMIASYGATLF